MSRVDREPLPQRSVDRSRTGLILPGTPGAAGASSSFRPSGEAASVRRSSRRRRVFSLKAALVVADMAVVAVAMVVAFRLRAVVPGPGHDLTGIPTRHLVVGALSLPLWAAIFVRYDLYRANLVAGRRRELSRLVHAVGASVAGMALIAFMLQLYVARGWVILTGVAGLILLGVEREVVRAALTRRRAQGRLLRPVLIVGADADAVDLSRTLAETPRLGYRVLGMVADIPAGSSPPPECPVIASIDGINDAIDATGADGVIVVASAVGAAVANRLARELPDAGVRVELAASLRDIAAERLGLRAVGAHTVLHVEPVRRHGWRMFAKRALDVTVSGVALIVMTPLLVLIALMIKLTSPGPLLFRQVRLGRDGHLFTLLKFRTMVADADRQLVDLRDKNDAPGPLFKMRDDPRVTRVGRYLRRFSLDELPQLWNVLRGEMTLVGPRPAIPEEVIGWMPELHQRLRVKPGITGMWQVYGRSDASFGEYCRLDLYYVDNWSLLVDLTILCKTIPAVLFRRGAY
ncbi:MAG TPA: sugar transferase [Acidimicrobiales bacterium]|nr:sugar transferase [Acidimicrobiales bacterium]